MRVHLLFAPERPWKNMPPGYREIHAQLRREIAAERGPSRKRVTHQARSKRFKQTGDLHG